jgi:phosphoadenosine phosphosulfate reductase
VAATDLVTPLPSAPAPPPPPPAAPVRIAPRRAERVDPGEIAEAGLRLESAPAEEIVAWAAGRFGSGLTLTASFQDCVLVDLAVKVVPDLEVVFLDTQYHFPETLAYVERVRRRYDLNLRVVRPQVAPDDRWATDTDSCCHVRKVEPLDRALAGRSAWMSGLRRADGPARAATPVVTIDRRRSLAKVNPLAAWSDEDVADYSARHDLPVHPLMADGYLSVGCWPCTEPVAPGEHARAGRWAGTEKTECGLHL